MFLWLTIVSLSLSLWSPCLLLALLLLLDMGYPLTSEAWCFGWFAGPWTMEHGGFRRSWLGHFAKAWIIFFLLPTHVIPNKWHCRTEAPMRFPASKLGCHGRAGSWEATSRSSFSTFSDPKICWFRKSLGWFVAPKVEASRVEARTSGSCTCRTQTRNRKVPGFFFPQKVFFCFFRGTLSIPFGWILVPTSTLLSTASHHYLCCSHGSSDEI